MLILLSFVLQAVSYEFRSRPGNVFGTKTYDIFLFINGLLGTLLVGVVIGTFFTGSDFTVARDNITTVGAPVISRWGNAWHGLESIANLRNLCLGAAVLFLARTLALLLFINRAGDEEPAGTVPARPVVQCPAFRRLLPRVRDMDFPRQRVCGEFRDGRGVHAGA